MTYRECPPSPLLQGRVAAYWSVERVADDAPIVQRVLPDGCADLIGDFARAEPELRWVGTMTRAIQVVAAGRQDLFGIRFAPGALYSLIGAPLSLLTDRTAGFADWGGGWRPPLDAWAVASTFAERCRLADASLLAMLPHWPLSDVAQLLQHLQTANAWPGSAADLADAIGSGQRTLQRRFLDHLGVSPRQHLRWLRFERSRQLLVLGDRPAVEIALAAGYSDQPHFVREFRRFAGVTPGRFG
jgi:AraC-like DNA-binding protein